MPGELHVLRLLSFTVLSLAFMVSPLWAGTVVSGDFNGDGFADLAVSVSREDIGTSPNAGIVHVIYGSAATLTSTDSQIWHQNRAGIADTAAADERFGAALAVGDFNGDTFDDLAIGVAGEVIQGIARGAVHVIYGSAAGLDSAGSQFFDQVDVGSSYASSSKFGTSLAAGDFNGDTFDDLIIAEPFKKVSQDPGAGQFTVMNGSAAGLDVATSQQWTVTATGIFVSRIGDEFGQTFAVGDFDDDGFEDLAVALPGRRTHGADKVGAVLVMYGTAMGLDGADAQLWEPSTPGMISTENEKERFGEAVAAGDYNGDGFSDLAIGAPGKLVNGVDKAGAIFVLYGTMAGLSVNGTQYFHQNTNFISEEAEASDKFGSALASGDFDDDGRDDLAIGVANESLPFFGEMLEKAGQVHVLLGSITGLTTNGNQIWNLKLSGMKGVKGANRFGAGLTTGDFDGDGDSDLAIAAPYESLAEQSRSGAVHVLYGTPMAGLLITDNQAWHQNRPGIKNKCDPNDRFGE